MSASPSVVFGACGVLFLGLALRFYDHTVDDAFISFRYAQNLVDGHGLVFNPGERVEGYTNFLWVLWASLSLRLGVDPEQSSRWLGLAASAASLFAAVRFGPSPARAPLAAWVAPLLLAVNPAFAVWATAGLEAPLFAALILWGTGLAAQGVERGELPIASAFLLALAALTRPEGAAIAFVVAVAAVVLSPREPRFWRSAVLWAGVVLAVLLPYLMWRFTYYGDLLPNTFYAKVGSTPEQLRRGLAYANDFFSATGYWLVPLAVAACWSARPRFAAVFAAVALALVATLVVLGGDGLPMHRFFVPVLGPYLLLVGWGTAWILARVTPLRGAKILAAAMLAACAVYSAVPAFRGPQYDYVQQDLREVGAWRQVGTWFREHARPDETLAVLPAGAIPYFSGLRAIDMLGLNDAHIARREMPRLGSGQAGHEKYDADYVLARRPRYVVVGLYGLAPEPRPLEHMVFPSYAAERELLGHPGFMAHYRPETARTAGGYFVYFVRSDP